MSKQIETICILLSFYNGELYIAEQIDSILSQEGVNVKILCRDDCSTDNTRDIIRDYADRYPDSIKLIEGKNLGFALSFTELLKYGVSNYPDIEYFAFADQDDVWLPEKMVCGINAVANESHDIPVAYCCATKRVDSDLNPLPNQTVHNPKELTRHRALIQNFATGCTMVFNRKAAVTYVSNLPEEIKVHDFLMYQICMFLGKMIYDPIPHILYRQHGNNQIGAPGAIGRMKKRTQGNYRKRVLEKQNRNFINAFRHLMNQNDIALFESFISYRNSIVSRIKLLFNFKISNTSVERDFFYRLKIILGGV